MEKIKIMISSVIQGLEAERDVIKEVFKNIPFVELIGAEPFNNSALGQSSSLATLEMARTCDLYVLILSERYGSELRGGKSATEAEYDEAVKADPTKVLVFKKECTGSIETKQQEFIDRVTDYYSGYFRPTFKFSHQLGNLVMESFVDWLKNRAELGKRLNFIDHFARIGRQILPNDISNVYYKVTKEYVEFEYNINNKSHIIQFQNSEIASDFWGCIYELQVQCDKWRTE